jgi:SAM-dependent methyltransferase
VRRHLPAGRLLEIGCAFGLYAEALSAFLDVTATDVSHYAVAKARERVGAGRVDFREGRVESFAFAAGSFHGVAAFDVLEHIRDLDGSVAELHRVLSPGGFLFLTVPVYDGPLGMVVHLLDRDPTHVHKWGRGQWSALARRHRFDVVESVGMVRYGLGRRYLFAAHPWLAPVGSALFLVLRKQP